MGALIPTTPSRLPSGWRAIRLRPAMLRRRVRPPPARSAAEAEMTPPTGWLRRRVLVILLLFSVVLNVCFLAGVAWTQLHPPARSPDLEQRYQRMAAELNLEPSQRAGFDTYVAAMRNRT